MPRENNSVKSSVAMCVVSLMTMVVLRLLVYGETHVCIARRRVPHSPVTGRASVRMDETLEGATALGRRCA